ncbi:MAG: hypothetical protein FJ125_14070, partial [Deltaproteobacteria bacterium]|nr:hypothetical protein [Deltaproteobacteria bacterium]
MSGIFQKLFGLGAVLDFNSKDAVGRMGTAERAAGSLRKGMLNIGKGARQGAGGMSQFALATLPLYTGLGLAVREAMKFEDGLARIGTMLDEQGQARIPQLGKDIDDLAMRYGAAADVLSEAGFTAVSAFGLNEQTAG